MVGMSVNVTDKRAKISNAMIGIIYAFMSWDFVESRIIM